MMSEKIKCPFCLYQNEILNDSLQWEDDGCSTHDCRGCDKEFIVHTSISFDFEAIDPKENPEAYEEISQ